MEPWLRISLLLCTFGFLRELRPSEPFVTEYLSGPWRNITADQVNKEIYPFGTYAVLAQLMIVFLITDILRYKPIIVLSACAGVILFAILLWTKKVWELQIGQIFYGTFNSCEVAYYTYIYAKVDKERYQLVTAHTRSAILCGKFLGAVLAQALVSTDSMDFRDLHFISFATQIVSLLISLTLPPVRRSLYFYSEKTTLENNVSEPIPTLKITDLPLDIKVSEQNMSNNTLNTSGSFEPTFSWTNATSLLWQHMVSAYTNSNVIRWSCWWSLATCGQLQVLSYVQLLWKDIEESNNNTSYYNGAVEAIVTILGAAGAMTAGLMNSKNHKKWHMWILTICSLLMGAFLVISAVTNLIWIAYVMYIFFGIVYFFVITIASATVAENLTDDSFGLIFGINTLIAYVLQTILTLIVVTDTFGYGLRPRKQFIVYGNYFLALAVLYCFAALINYYINKRKKNCTNILNKVS